MPPRYRVVHYLNQFFAGFGGEDQASLQPDCLEGPVGPGRPLQDALGETGWIVLTAFCGDDYFSEHRESAETALLQLVREAQPDLFIAGPAFNAGRYGNACGALCRVVSRTLKIPAITGMSKENPGLEFRNSAFIVSTSDTVRGMGEALRGMSALARKLLEGRPLRSAREERYFPRGFRKNFLVGKTGAERALDMILAKVAGEPFDSEMNLARFDRVPPAPPVQDLTRATLGLITTGGLVPKGNPDRLDSTRATRFGRYPIEGLVSLDGKTFEANHGGYSTSDVNADPHRLVPLDVLRDLEREGRIGKLFGALYTFAGCSTYYEQAARMGREMAEDLKAHGVDAVLLTST